MRQFADLAYASGRTVERQHRMSRRTYLRLAEEPDKFELLVRAFEDFNYTDRQCLTRVPHHFDLVILLRGNGVHWPAPIWLHPSVGRFPWTQTTARNL